METAYPKYARASRAFALNINKISLLYRTYDLSNRNIRNVALRS